MKHLRQCLWLFLGMVLLFLPVCQAANIPEAPTQHIYVTDKAQMLDDATKNKIQSLGEALNNEHKAQVVVLTVDSLEGEDIETYANEVYRKWGIGDKKENNGVLLLIARDDRKFRIEVGYGLEGAISDGYAGDELRKLAPFFKNEQYSEGVLLVYTELVTKVYHEYGDTAKADALAEEAGKITPPVEEEEPDWELYFSLVIIIIAIILWFFGGGSSGGSSRRRRSSGGFYGGWSSGSSSSGGFGGGRSGGGGASGGW